MFISNAYAQAAGGSGGGIDVILIQLMPLIAIVAIMYFLVIRPQQARMKAHQTMVENLRRGDHIVTSSGILGKIVKVDEGELTVEVADNVRIRILRQAVQDVRSKTEPAKDDNAKG
jgi:preprotein translocase subunit YajC